MKCTLIQQLLDAKKIIEQFHSLDDVIYIQGPHHYSVKDWFVSHPQILRQLQLQPKELTYQALTKQLNRAMADLF